MVLKVGVRLRGVFTLLIVVSFLVFAGCGAKQPTSGDIIDETLVDAEPLGVDEGVVFIESINVVGSEDAVLIETDGPVKYTAFRLSDPPRLILDLPGVNVSKVEEALTVDNTFMVDIIATSYGDDDKNIGRIEIGLQEGVNHSIKVGDNSLLINLEKDVFPDGDYAADTEDFGDEEIGLELTEDEGLLALGDEDEEDEFGLGEDFLEAEDGEELIAIDEGFDDDVLADDDDFEVFDEYEEVVEKKEPKVEIAKKQEIEVLGTLEEARSIIDITTETVGNSSAVKIVADGVFGSYNSFGLSDPPRVVLDIWGIGSSLDTKSVSLDVLEADRVRVGVHPDKVRLVFDLDGSTLPPHSVGKKNNVILISFGSSAEQAVKMEDELPDDSVEIVTQTEVEDVYEDFETEADIETPQAVEMVDDVEPTETGDAEEYLLGKVQVQSVKFQKLKDKGRLTIVNSRKAQFDVSESVGGMAVIIDLLDTVIPEALMMTLDASELSTPVSTISAFQATTEPTSDVRILVKLYEEILYEVSGDGKEIIVDFPLYVDTVELEEAAASLAESLAEAEGVVVVKGPDGDITYTGERITLEMVDAQVIDIIGLLAEVSGFNIIALPEDVSGTMTLRLVDVPWDQAFDLILKTKGLDKTHEGNIVRVAPSEKIRQEKETALASKKAEAKLENLETEYIRINYDKADSLSSQVQTLMSDRGSITSHGPTNTLIIKDTRNSILEVLDYIKRVDIPTPQVLIEARIVEAESSFARDLGVQWGIDLTANSLGTGKTHSSIFGSSEQLGSQAIDPGTQFGTGSSPSTSVTKEGIPSTAGVTNYAVNLPASGTAGTLGALGFILGKVGGHPGILDLRLSAGESEGLVKTISRPRITTMDNMEAKIEQGESIPFSTTSAGGSVTQFIDANLSLTVTPQITPDGSVLMQIKASRNSVGSFKAAGGEPSINKKEASTNVLVRDGETTVIGGIIISDSQNTQRGIPYLMNIPIIGWLFKSKSILDTQRELLIFITPTIIKHEVAG